MEQLNTKEIPGAFETFAHLYPIEAYDAYPDRFCDYYSKRQECELTDDEIKAIVEFSRDM